MRFNWWKTYRKICVCNFVFYSFLFFFFSVSIYFILFFTAWELCCETTNWISFVGIASLYRCCYALWLLCLYRWIIQCNVKRKIKNKNRRRESSTKRAVTQPKLNEYNIDTQMFWIYGKQHGRHAKSISIKVIWYLESLETWIKCACIWSTLGCVLHAQHIHIHSLILVWNAIFFSFCCINKTECRSALFWIPINFDNSGQTKWEQTFKRNIHKKTKNTFSIVQHIKIVWK